MINLWYHSYMIGILGYYTGYHYDSMTVWLHGIYNQAICDKYLSLLNFLVDLPQKTCVKNGDLISGKWCFSRNWKHHISGYPPVWRHTWFSWKTAKNGGLPLGKSIMNARFSTVTFEKIGGYPIFQQTHEGNKGGKLISQNYSDTKVSATASEHVQTCDIQTKKHPKEIV